MEPDMSQVQLRARHRPDIKLFSAKSLLNSKEN